MVIAVYIHNSAVLIHCGYPDLHYGEIFMDNRALIMDVYVHIMAIHNCCELHIRNWIVDVRNCIMDIAWLNYGYP